MDLELGPTLREARIRRKIDLSEVEQRTKIRVRYLRALENEEWDVLPGGSYTRSFIRTYGSFLGLDGERLADEFRRLHADPVATRYPHVEPVGSGGGPRPPGFRAPRLGPGGVTALVAAAVIGILIVIGVTVGDDDGGGGSEARTGREKPANKTKRQQQRQSAQERREVAVELTAIADVWVCMVNQQGVPVVNGLILGAGARQGPFRSREFDVTFGNGQVALEVNGREVPVADTPNPIGYELAPGEVRELGIAERPTCT
jgi:cytoskeleton protein RodZ